MSSEKQIQANRRNAQRSTGPRSPEGKAAVSRNALKHGFRAEKVIFQEFNQETLQELRDELAAQWQPANYTERVLIEQMAVALHKLTMFEELEAALDSQMEMHRFSPNLQILWRRQASLERSFHKAIDTLLKLRRAEARQSKASRPEPTRSKPEEINPPQPASPPAPAEFPSEPPAVVILAQPPDLAPRG